MTGRRRKKSCVARSANPGTCEECFARGVQCRSQEVSLGTKTRPANAKQDLQQRVVELEKALLSINQKSVTPPRIVEVGQGTTKTSQQLPLGISLSTPVVSPDSKSESLLEHAPVLTLFDNAILSRQPHRNGEAHLTGLPPSDPSNNKANPKTENIRSTLLSLFPSPQRQEAVLNDSHAWWAIWQDIFPHIFDLAPSTDISQFMAGLKTSGSVQKVASALLCLLVILQESPPNFNTGHDSAGATDRTKLALSIIDDSIIADDELAGTIDGIECMVLRAKYENNIGHVRKAWLTFRRALPFAHLLGLHKSQGGFGSKTLRRESLWKALYSSDRFASLNLGLPYGPSEIHSNVGRDSEMSAKGIHVPNTHEHYLLRLATIVGHVVDRNQQLPSNNMLPLTFKIEAEMIELAASMTNDWWKSGLEPENGTDQLHNLQLPQFWHHVTRTLLHLPFMLKATTDRRFEYNKQATLESARQLLARYRVIRPIHGFGSHICKMIDFQSFTAAMILVLNLLDHYRKPEMLDHSEAESDQEVVSLTRGILRRSSVETDGGMALHAARALEIFGKVKDITMGCGKPVGECTTRVVIPYFGTVVIGPGTSFKDQLQAQKPGETPQPQQLPTPSDQSLDGSTPGSVPTTMPSMGATIPGDHTQAMGMNGDFFADINFDLDQDWSWFWENIDIPSAGAQRTQESQ